MSLGYGPPTRLVILPFVVYLTCSEHREALALEKWVSRAPSDFPFVIYLFRIFFLPPPRRKYRNEDPHGEAKKTRKSGNDTGRKPVLIGLSSSSFALHRWVVRSFPPRQRSGRLGAFLVDAAWERRLEGPAYLLSTMKLLYLAG